MYSKAKETIDVGESSVSTAHRFPQDRLLRVRGFRIYSRPKRGKAFWERDGKLYRHDEAMKLAMQPSEEKE